MKPLRDRPFVRCLLARELRRVASYKNRNNQFTEELFDQFMAKCRSAIVIDRLCTIVEEAGDFDWKKVGNWMNQHFGVLRGEVEAFDDVNLEAPETHYNMAPVSRGRKARRAAGPRYQSDVEFQRDKEQFEAELRGDVGPLSEEPNEEATS